MQKRKSIITENNELITTLLVQKKDLEKIIEFTFDLTGEIKQIYDANLNLDSDEYIEITSPDIISFIMNINAVINGKKPCASEYAQGFFGGGLSIKTSSLVIRYTDKRGMSG